MQKPEFLSQIPADWADPIFNAAEASALLAQKGHILLSIVGGGHLLGRTEAGTYADILSLFVPPHSRRQGQGEILLQAFLVYLPTLGAQGLTLEVRADNPAALALYSKLGLKTLHHRPAYYGDVDGVVMGVVF